ncbi:SRPBCC family protein [Stakelama saccharophila]|uniref:SRPBCC family protein n=1 Tax=Stakelama saccharophila TaxID=3075605 RepID=A0ABZ0BAL0_9SPHN|nr:SRPBCC family protein [Stakelama sp. W311]WNO54319.1 SRPBCC family protein [Stakelama sp. W311]
MPDFIEKQVRLNASVDRVWKALTDHEEFGAWFRVKLDRAFAQGGQVSGRITYPGYEHLKWEVRVIAMERPRRFAFTWHPYAIDPEHDYSEEPPTTVEFFLTPIEDGTLLTVRESGFDAIPAERRDLALRMNDDGWAQQMENIERHVEG